MNEKRSLLCVDCFFDACEILEPWIFALLAVLILLLFVAAWVTQYGIPLP